MNNHYIWLIIVGMVLVAIVSRAFFVVLGDYFNMSPRIERAMQFAPSIAISAMLAPEIFLSNGEISIVNNPLFWSALIALGVATLSRSIICIVAAGMLTLWLIQ